jgi:hypothetical protein
MAMKFAHVLVDPNYLAIDGFWLEPFYRSQGLEGFYLRPFLASVRFCFMRSIG